MLCNFPKFFSVPYNCFSRLPIIIYPQLLFPKTFSGIYRYFHTIFPKTHFIGWAKFWNLAILMKVPLFFFFKVDVLQNSVPPGDIKIEATRVFGVSPQSWHMRQDTVASLSPTPQSSLSRDSDRCTAVSMRTHGNNSDVMRVRRGCRWTVLLEELGWKSLQNLL